MNLGGRCTLAHGSVGAAASSSNLDVRREPLYQFRRMAITTGPFLAEALALVKEVNHGEEGDSEDDRRAQARPRPPDPCSRVLLRLLLLRSHAVTAGPPEGPRAGPSGRPPDLR